MQPAVNNAIEQINSQVAYFDNSQITTTTLSSDELAYLTESLKVAAQRGYYFRIINSGLQQYLQEQLAAAFARVSNLNTENQLNTLDEFINLLQLCCQTHLEVELADSGFAFSHFFATCTQSVSAHKIDIFCRYLTVLEIALSHQLAFDLSDEVQSELYQALFISTPCYCYCTLS